MAKTLSGMGGGCIVARGIYLAIVGEIDMIIGRALKGQNSLGFVIEAQSQSKIC